MVDGPVESDTLVVDHFEKDVDLHAFAPYEQQVWWLTGVGYLLDEKVSFAERGRVIGTGLGQNVEIGGEPRLQSVPGGG